MTRHLHGWRPDRPDPRDYRAGRLRSYLRSLAVPSFIDLGVGRLPRMEDQGQLGSCVGHGTTSAEEYLALKAGKPVVELSRLFVYYAGRVWVERQPATADGGMEIRDAMKALATFGVCAEDAWPYDVSKFAVCPPPGAIAEAKHRTIISYWRLPTLNAIRVSLAQGYPVVAGFTCFESLESDDTARTGVVAMPQPDEATIGGHCVLLVGYDDRSQLLKFENSWGPGWGDHGFGYLPYDYRRKGWLTDCWTIRGAQGV